jgi:adenylosuccinate lyase
VGAIVVSYRHPFEERYASKEMLSLFSKEEKLKSWRNIWIALAKASQKVGLPITDEQIEEMERQKEKIDLSLHATYEEQCRHEVMAEIRVFGEQCPKAKPILHLGATSCLVQDNADVLVQKKALSLLLAKICSLLESLTDFALKEKSTLCLSYTHLQPAQPTTMGKRACLWLQDLLLDLEKLTNLHTSLKLLGAKGATGTQSSFLTLLQGDKEGVKQLDTLFCSYLENKEVFAVTGQTYPRKQDSFLYHALSGFAASCYKFATDIRLLSSFGELREGFLQKQVGSSAMPYKKNPLYSERICALARFLMNLSANGDETHANQWLERSLDDSANRRIALPEAFIAADSLVSLTHYVVSQMAVNHEQVEKRLQEHLTLLMSEVYLMEGVRKGKDRQTLHETFRTLLAKTPDCKTALQKMAQEGGGALEEDQARSFLYGRAIEQTEEFCEKALEKITNLRTHFPQIKTSFSIFV